MKRYLFALLALVFFAAPAPSEATPGFQKLFVAKYPATKGTVLDTCSTCHMPAIKGFVNAYGVALMDKEVDFGAMEGLDSDGDGISNIEEIKALQYPGSQARTDEHFIFKNEKGTIDFNHEKHSLAEAYTSKGKCANCHAPQMFPRVFDDRVSAKKTAHTVCVTCHKVSRRPNAPTLCKGCHGQE